MLFINQILFLIFLMFFSELLGNEVLPNWWIGKHPHKTLIINEGDPIEISCLTEKPTIFFYPKHSKSSDFKISHEKKDSKKILHTFRRPKAIRGDTDFYCCFEVNSTTITVDDFDSDFTTQKPLNLTYIYVRSKNHAFANGHSRNVYEWSKGASMRLFCRPSSPDIHVELEHHYRGNRRVLTTDKRVIWEPKFGFIVQNVQPVVDNGLYVCKANYNGHTQELLYSISIFISDESFIFGPYITDNGESINVGKTINLNCSIILTNLTNATKHELKWITPAKRDRVTTSIESKTVDAGLVVTNKLNVNNFSEDDEGDYKCDFVNLTNSKPETKSVKKSLKIYDPESQYIKIIYDRVEKDFVRYTGEDMYIIAEVDAFPRPKVQWLNPRGEEMQDSEKFFVNNSYFYPRLIIENIELADAGIYTLRVSYEDKIKTMKFTLKVKSL